jgi:RNA polymerase sigma-70 factor (ECF subfamily)
MQGGAAAVERVFREEYGRLIASLVRRFGDSDIAEEAAGDALLAALEKWPDSGVPANPGGWLTITAGNRAIDAIRREKQRDAKHQAAFMYFDDTPHDPTGPVEDDRLRLLFTCCHPGLAPEARIALTLRLLGGLSVAEIAQAFLVPETTVGQRITRAKKKIGTGDDCWLKMRPAIRGVATQVATPLSPDRATTFLETATDQEVFGH